MGKTLRPLLSVFFPSTKARLSLCVHVYKTNHESWVGSNRSTTFLLFKLYQKLITVVDPEAAGIGTGPWLPRSFGIVEDEYQHRRKTCSPTLFTDQIPSLSGGFFTAAPLINELINYYNKMMQ